MLSSLQMYSHISWAISAAVLCFWGVGWGSVSSPSDSAVPAGCNKQQTCFSSSNSTFAAPSLWHRPYHYPHKQQKYLCNLTVEGISPAFCQPLSGRDLHWMHKMTKENPPACWCYCVPQEEEELRGTCEDVLWAGWHLKAGWDSSHGERDWLSNKKSTAVQHSSCVTSLMRRVTQEVSMD